MTLFEEWWATYKNSGRKRQLSVDDLSLDAFRAGMLAAADVAEDPKRSALDRNYTVASRIREAAK